MTDRRRATSAFLWSGAQAASGAAFQLGSTVVLARLLVPKDFGVVALATVFVRFLAYFSQMGFGPAIVQRETVDDADLRGLFSLSVTIGIVFTVVGASLAWILGGEVAPVLTVLSLTFTLNGIAAVPLGVLRRDLRYREIVTAELVGQFGGNGVVTIALASAGFGVWSIVIGMLTQQLLIATLALWFGNRPSRRVFFGRPSPGCRSYFDYGIRHSLNTFLEFLYFNVEVFVVGSVLGSTSAGFYNRAYSLTHLPVEQVFTAVGRVLFPLLSRLRGNVDRDRVTFVAGFLLCGVFATGFAAAAFVSAEQITDVMLGPKWRAVVPIIQVLAVAVPVRYLLSLQSTWLDAIGVLKARNRVVGTSLALKASLIGLALWRDWSFVTLLSLAVSCDFVWQLLYFVVVPNTTSAKARLLPRCFGLLMLHAGFTAAVVGIITWQGGTLQLGTGLLFVVQLGAGAVCVLVALVAVVRSGMLGLDADELRRLPLVGRLARRPVFQPVAGADP